jgi:hypothetical protein
MDESSRVRKLVDSIKTDKLETVTSRIMSDSDLITDFNCAVRLYKDYIARRKSQLALSSGQIAGVGLGRNGGNGDNGRRNRRAGNGSRNGIGKRRAHTARVDIKDRYYTKEEYAKLSSEERSKLHELRKKRHRTGNNDRNSSQSHVASVNDGSARDDMNSTGSSEATVQANNRNNPNLTRQRGVNRE